MRNIYSFRVPKGKSQLHKRYLHFLARIRKHNKITTHRRKNTLLTRESLRTWENSTVRQALGMYGKEALVSFWRAGKEGSGGQGRFWKVLKSKESSGGQGRLCRQGRVSEAGEVGGRDTDVCAGPGTQWSAHCDYCTGQGKIDTLVHNENRET